MIEILMALSAILMIRAAYYHGKSVVYDEWLQWLREQNDSAPSAV